MQTSLNREGAAAPAHTTSDSPLCKPPHTANKEQRWLPYEQATARKATPQAAHYRTHPGPPSMR